MQIPFVGFQPVTSSEHMAAFGVFGLCQLYAFNEYIKSKLSQHFYDILFRSLVLLIGFVALSAGVFLTVIGSK
jgi:dolichyl-diphosphooligosaccharide--protein glycosyltransferase